MRFRSTQDSPFRAQGSDADCESRRLEDSGFVPAEQPAHLRPFVERRRRAPIQTPWPEALDSLQRHLLGYESAIKQLAESENNYRSLFEAAPIGIFQVTPVGEPVNMNAEMVRILGYGSMQEYLAAIAADESLKFFDPGRWNEEESLVCGSVVQDSIEMQIRCFNGGVKWVRFNLRAVREDGKVVRFDGTAEDVTERKHVEIRTELLAYYDLLTGTPNRMLFHDRINEVIANAGQARNHAALLLLDFDRFKIINDSLGEHFGNRLLQEIAERIRAGVGESGTVARLGGAEFGVVLHDCHNRDHVDAAAGRILANLSGEYSLQSHDLSVPCSMGISVFPQNGEDYETLLKKAELAKCYARELGSNNFQFFKDEMNDRIQERLRMESGLRLALVKKELYLEYQPQVDIRTGEVVGLEALLRWNSPLLGLVPPGRFIGIAESSGLIVPIGEWVLRTACSQVRRWQERGLRPVPVAVNVSPIQFRQEGFCELVREVLRNNRLEPEFLELEMTENLLMSNADSTASILAELRAMGVMLAIDDFGTGYSSLSYLREFKVNRLKIARTFIQNVSTDPDDAAITIAIIEMAKAMNLDVLAEGVEREEQLLFLRSQNCHTIQGFYFSRPVAVGEVDRHIRSGFSQLLPTMVA